MRKLNPLLCENVWGVDGSHTASSTSVLLRERREIDAQW